MFAFKEHQKWAFKALRKAKMQFFSCSSHKDAYKNYFY